MKSRETINDPLPRQRRRYVYLCFVWAGALLGLMPRRVVFLLLMIFDILRLPGRRRLQAAYFPYVSSFLAVDPRWRFSGPLGRQFPASSVRVLYDIGAYREACRCIRVNGLAGRSIDMTKLLAQALFELGEFEEARDATSLSGSHVELQRRPDLAFLKSMLEMIEGDETAALKDVSKACRRAPRLMRPHQNIAARSDSDYSPNYLDVLCGSHGRLFDLCNFTGQRVTHVGRGELGVPLFERALVAQSELQKMPAPRISPELAQLLEDMGTSFGELRIIPEEWTTQIGHLGMLDILFRMRELGWWTGKALLVVRPGLIANAAFFRLFENVGEVLIIGQDISDLVGEELLSLQRWCGMNFNAFRLPNGKVVPWQEAGALAIEQWEREGRGHPLRDQFDRVFGSPNDIVNQQFRCILGKWGMKSEDWYVCLHTRDAAHYFELMGTGQTHRNAPLETCLDAVRFITAKGGWVIKLGGANSPKLPQMDRVIDYALGEFKSDLMDIQLIRNAKAFIGTTSGLTNVAVSFGIPCAIVNGITTDSQLWHKAVRFALKPVRLADETMITQRQLSSSPWRWRVFDAAVLGRSGGHPVNNTADEILETVREVDALASGHSAEFESEYETEALLSRWKDQLALPHHYGTSRPSLYYLKKYERDFLAS